LYPFLLPFVWAAQREEEDVCQDVESQIRVLASAVASTQV
jgi:hypothetical protein